MLRPHRIVTAEHQDLLRRSVAEALGTGLLIVAVIGSGIMATRLSPDDVGLQLLENAIATGGALVALILAFGSVSGAASGIGRPAGSNIRTSPPIAVSKRAASRVRSLL